MKKCIVIIVLFTLLLITACEKSPDIPLNTDSITESKAETDSKIPKETYSHYTYIDTEPYEDEPIEDNPHRVYSELAGCYEQGEFTRIDGDLISEYIGMDKFNVWVEQMQAAEKNDYTNDQGNIYDFVRYFNIPREVMEKLSTGEYPSYSKEMINDIYTLDEVTIKIKNVSPIAIVHNNVIYSARWFANNPAEKYVEAGIDPDEVIEKLSWYIEYDLYYPNEYYDYNGYYNHYVREYNRYCDLVGRTANTYEEAIID